MINMTILAKYFNVILTTEVHSSGLF